MSSCYFIYKIYIVIHDCEISDNPIFATNQKCAFFITQCNNKSLFVPTLIKL